MKYANYRRRLLASLVDLTTIYVLTFLLIRMFPIQEHKWLLAFLISIFHHSIGYISIGSTMGELLLGLKVEVIEGRFKQLNLINRAILLSITYVPFFFMIFSVIIIIVVITASVANLKVEKYKERKMLFWESASNTVVIER